MRRILVTLLPVVVIFILITVTSMIYESITESNFIVAFIGGGITFIIGTYLIDNL